MFILIMSKFSQVVDPWGTIIAQCDNTKELDVVVTTIDLEKVDLVRANMPLMKHRRNDVYGLVPLKLTSSLDIYRQVPFTFERHVIPKETVFYETEHSVAFTNIRCVVPGRILNKQKKTSIL